MRKAKKEVVIMRKMKEYTDDVLEGKELVRDQQIEKVIWINKRQGSSC